MHQKLRFENQKLRIRYQELRIEHEKLRIGHQKFRIEHQKLRIDHKKLSQHLQNIIPLRSGTQPLRGSFPPSLLPPPPCGAWISLPASGVPYSYGPLSMVRCIPPNRSSGIPYSYGPLSMVASTHGKHKPFGYSPSHFEFMLTYNAYIPYACKCRYTTW